MTPLEANYIISPGNHFTLFSLPEQLFHGKQRLVPEFRNDDGTKILPRLFELAFQDIATEILYTPPNGDTGMIVSQYNGKIMRDFIRHIVGTELIGQIIFRT